MLTMPQYSGEMKHKYLIYLPCLHSLHQKYFIMYVNSFLELIINVNTETFDVGLIELTEDK